MLFREFNIIAAAAYAAQCAAEPLPHRLNWNELDESVQNLLMQSAMAVARGEAVTTGEVFAATAKAILDYNAGQGLLALEDLVNLGSTVMSLELLQPDDVADTNIRESVVGLLYELKERREKGTLQQPGGIAGDELWSNPRYRGLQFASRLDGQAETADVFARFLANADGKVCYEAERMLELALDVASKLGFEAAHAGVSFAERVVETATGYHQFVNPAPEIAEPQAETAQ